jgi:hypothetical protein
MNRGKGEVDRRKDKRSDRLQRRQRGEGGERAKMVTKRGIERVEPSRGRKGEGSEPGERAR